jgi:tetratricopeptide (TPR) repeat protein
MLAQCQNALKQFDNEVVTLNLILAKHPADHLVHNRKGQALHKLRRNEEAVASFREAIRINPRFKPAYDGLLKIFQGTNNNYEQRQVVTDMMKAFGDKPIFHHLLCELYTREAFHEEALKACRRAVARDPKEPKSHAYLGKTLFELQETQEAEKTLVRAAQRFPRSEDAQRATGELYLKLSNYPAAARYPKRATDLKPRSVDAQLSYAKVALEMDDVSAALAAFKRACEVDSRVAGEFQTAANRLKNNPDIDLVDRFRGEANRCRLSAEVR